MRRDLHEVLVSPEVAAVAVERDVTTVRRWVRLSRLRNHGTSRRVRVSLGEVLDVMGDPMRVS